MELKPNQTLVVKGQLSPTTTLVIGSVNNGIVTFVDQSNNRTHSTDVEAFESYYTIISVTEPTEEEVETEEEAPKSTTKKSKSKKQ